MSVILALLIDRCWGEPPPAIHPVVWMGQYLKYVGRKLPTFGRYPAFVLGTSYWLLGAAGVGGGFWCAERLLEHCPWWMSAIVTALLLKPLFAMRMLLQEVGAVEEALARGLSSGRERLAMIVSRDTKELDAGQIRESALESLAENLSDSVIAPLFWFVLLGLPGAAVYRFANTADAMWGYRGRWEWAGKFAARADDVLNWIPARITALALLLTGPQWLRVLRRLPGEAARTASPNSGWPMSALALSLDVHLRKPQVYVLNAQGAAPCPDDVAIALRRAALSAWVVSILFGGAAELMSLWVHA